MKYERLTKEQLEELHQEFINFLATQSIAQKEWKQIKEKQPQVAEKELDIFSDLIWEGVLTKSEYLQNSSSQQLFLFKLAEKEMTLIVVKNTNSSKDITTTSGLEWLQNNIKSDSVNLYTATKSYSEERNLDVFELIRQGAEITEGVLFEQLSQIMDL